MEGQTTMNNATFNSEETIDALVDSLMTNESQTLKERVGDNTVELRNYLKYDGGSGRKTGNALLLNKISNLSVVDIDINKSYDDEKKEKVRKNVMMKLDDNDVVVQTGSGGLHIYCNTNFFPATSNRMIKCYSCNDFDVDLMSSIDENKRSLIVMADSKVRANAREKIKSYSFIRGGYDSKVIRSVNDVLNDLGVNITVKQTPEIETIMNDNDSDISDELAQALVDGICDFEVHNDGGSMTLDKEITLFTLFQAINSLPQRFINEAYDNVYNECKLTDKAKENFENARARYQHLKTSPFVLAKIEKLYQKEYYDEYVKPLLTAKTVFNKIDLTSSFSMTDIRAKAENKEYKNYEEVIEDLSKVIRFIDIGNKMFIQKEWNSMTKTWGISFVLNSNMKDSLKMIKLWEDGRKKITAYEALLTKLSKFSIKGVRFNSNDENEFSTFQGFKYNVLDNVNYEIINAFLNFVKEIICDSNDEIYKYVINWISFIIQNPGKKAGTSLILKGLQGIGKNTFTDVLSELLAGYSVKNVTEISELTGNFNSVVENKMLIVLNELRNAGEDRLANFNSLKSIITDDSIRINEKNQPRRTAENVANFIFCTNSAYPVKVEAGDRRYVVLRVNGKYKGNMDYWSEFYKSFTTEFYNNLLTYFVKNDISNFNVRVIPMTEAKQDLIDASRSPLDLWICDNYDELCVGIVCSDALLSKPSEMKDRTFQSQLKDKCDRKRKRVNGKLEWCYVLKDECKSIYKQTVYNEEDDEKISEEDLPVHETC